MEFTTRSARRADVLGGRKKIARPLFVLLILAGCAVVCISLTILFFSKLCMIQFVDVSAPEGIDASAIRSTVFAQMEKKRFSFFSQKNIFFLSQKDLENELKRQFFIEHFSIKRKPPHTLSITLSGKPFRLLWVAHDTVYDVSSDGTLFRTVDSHSPLASAALAQRAQDNQTKQLGGQKQRTDIPIVVDESAQSLAIGDSVLSPDALLFILDAWRTFDQSGIHLSYSTTVKNSPTLTFFTTEGWSVLLSSIGDLTPQVDHVHQVLNRYFKGGRSGLHYIDARFDNRVFYK